jgi:hypothetical protein
MRPPLTENRAYETTLPFICACVPIKRVNRFICMQRVCAIDMMTLEIAQGDFHQETPTTLVSHT